MKQTLDLPDPVAYLLPDSSIFKKKPKLEREILELQSTYLLRN